MTKKELQKLRDLLAQFHAEYFSYGTGSQPALDETDVLIAQTIDEA